MEHNKPLAKMVKFENITNFSLNRDLKRLEVNPNSLKLKFNCLAGTRLILQYENKEYVFTISKTFKPKIIAYGITNRCEDGKYILFIEYDHIYKDLMYKNLDNLLKLFPNCLENFYIAKTEKETQDQEGNFKGSYHVVNFVKLFKYQIEEMLKFTDCDKKFLEIPQKTAHKTHVLRISEKIFHIGDKIIKERPVFLEIYPQKSFNKKLECSNAHYIIFRKEWKINDNLWHKFDELTKIEMHRYSTPQKESDKNEII